MKERLIGMLLILAIAFIFSSFIYEYINLKKFKSCYDINFQDVKCEKYKNY